MHSRGPAFVLYVGRNLADVLCEHQQRVVGNDNRVSFAGHRLQIPNNRTRLHCVMVKVRVHRYPNGRLAIFHGPLCLARYDAKGIPMQSKTQATA